MSNRYLIKVGPGTYSEQVTMKPFVDIEGSGEKVTTITSASNPTVLGAGFSELRRLTVAQTGGGVGIQNSGPSPTIKHVTVDATGAGAVGVHAQSGAAPVLIATTVSSSDRGVVVFQVTATIRDSILAGVGAGLDLGGIPGFPATANVVNTQIVGGATMPAATDETYNCLGAYDATFTELDTSCQ